MYNSVDLKFASGAKSTEALLCDLGRYDFFIQPVRRIRSHNVYNLASVARAYLLGALQQQNIPTSHIPDLFQRIDQNALDYACDQFETGEIDTLICVFLSFTPDEDFTGVCTNAAELPEILQTLGHFTAIDLSEFLTRKLQGDL
ncbi:MAG: hypothetical protein O3A90_06015 [Proteobacteria bacterium]|nr:hypothetical protein [Pseudomonadota bacterium]MDA0851016.1 hypothetical protein [Pseudomonadota bacterium]MDA1295248.1 hypothetical protein [Pseudomonadota bacterium]